MDANGTTVPVTGSSLKLIGVALLKASPKGDGVGLKVVLTETEERQIETLVGMHVGAALLEVIGDAVGATGGDPNSLRFEYNAHTRTFETFTLATV